MKKTVSILIALFMLGAFAAGCSPAVNEPESPIGSDAPASPAPVDPSAPPADGGNLLPYDPLRDEKGEAVYFELVEIDEATGKTTYSYRDYHYIVQNADRAIKLLSDAAERNYNPAQFALAKIYLAGYVSSADIAKAIELLEKASEAGNQYAQYQFGKMLLFGQQVDQDEEAGKEWLRRSAAQGNIYAQRLLDNYGHAPIGLMTFRLLAHLARIMRDDMEQKQKADDQIIDRKIRRQIAEKKQALGQKMG